MTTPSPGPWLTSGNHVLDANGLFVAATGPRDERELEPANLRLIAAAPVLLAAAQLARTTFGATHHFRIGADGCEACKALAALTAAIAQGEAL